MPESAGSYAKNSNLLKKNDFLDVVFQPTLRRCNEKYKVSVRPDNSAANFALTVVKSLSPNDAAEAMLAAQMAAIHIAAMRAAGQLARAEIPPHQEAAMRAFDKLSRT